MCKSFRDMLENRRGATALEYGLIAALVTLALIGGATTLGTNLNSFFSELATQVSSQTDAIKAQ